MPTTPALNWMGSVSPTCAHWRVGSTSPRWAAHEGLAPHVRPLGTVHSCDIGQHSSGFSWQVSPKSKAIARYSEGPKLEKHGAGLPTVTASLSTHSTWCTLSGSRSGKKILHSAAGWMCGARGRIGRTASVHSAAS